MIAPDTATADGASTIVIRVIVDTTLTVAKRVVSLATTGGSFASTGAATATLAPDATGAAMALLRAPGDSAVALLTATVDGVAVTRFLTFRKALPERVEVIPAQFILVAGRTRELAIAATLRRGFGAPSPGLPVRFDAVAMADTLSPIGVFLPGAVSSAADGRVATRFSVVDSTFRGALRIRAAVEGTGLRGEAVVEVVAP